MFIFVVKKLSFAQTVSILSNVGMVMNNEL